jgi:hypothetical protein
MSIGLIGASFVGPPYRHIFSITAQYPDSWVREFDEEW